MDSHSYLCGGRRDGDGVTAMGMDGNFFLTELAARRRFGMKPGLDVIRALMRELGDPQKSLRFIHVAGTNGKGATAAVIDSVLRAAGWRTGRYTSPHLVRINERFFIDGHPACDEALEKTAERVFAAVRKIKAQGLGEVTFFEALTAIAFLFYAEEFGEETGRSAVVLETGLGGRLDATNIVEPENLIAAVITRIGLDHCDWLGHDIEEIAAEKAGIIKSGRPVICGATPLVAKKVIKAAADRLCAQFHYAPDEASMAEVPDSFSLAGSFNRENAATALAFLRTLGIDESTIKSGMGNVVWPARFQEIGKFVVDGAHNPPAAKALASALPNGERFLLIAGFCGDKDVRETLQLLKGHVAKAVAVKTCNPRSLAAAELAEIMRDVGIEAQAAGSLDDALSLAKEFSGRTLVCGSLFLAGEAVMKLGAFPWMTGEIDPSEKL